MTVVTEMIVTETKPFPDPEQPCFIRVPVRALDAVFQVLEAMKANQGNRGLTARYTHPGVRDIEQRFIDLADSKVARTGEIEIDSDTVVSEGEGGAYVMAWVWVHTPECDDCGERHFPEETCLGPESPEDFKENADS